MSDGVCHVCGAYALRTVPEYGRLVRVTSDCRPWKQGGSLGQCWACGVVQKPADEAWHREVGEIYSQYELYPQGGGAEQVVFNSRGGMPATRSRRLVDRLLAEFPLPPRGRLLDVGCGNGGLLRSFHAVRPDWDLEGTELDDRNRGAVEALPGVRAFHQCAPWAAPGRFHVVTLIHVLEHLVSPIEYLTKLVEKIEPGGFLMIESPDASSNPFDLVIADHVTHLCGKSLPALVEAAGFAVGFCSSEWVPREVSLVGSPRASGATRGKLEHCGSNVDAARELEWLHSVRNDALSCASHCQIGVFGTSIAAAWLWSEMRSSVAFFVDEDPNRVGRRFLGLPVVAPNDVRPGAVVYVALVPRIAGEIAARCTRPGIDYVVPPELTEPGGLPQQSAR